MRLSISDLLSICFIIVLALTLTTQDAYDGGNESSKLVSIIIFGGWRGLAPGHATRWWGHLAHLLTPPFRLYILLGEKNPKDPINFP
jgi:hypothetical protein